MFGRRFGPLPIEISVPHYLTDTLGGAIVRDASDGRDVARSPVALRFGDLPGACSGACPGDCPAAGTPAPR